MAKLIFLHGLNTFGDDLIHIGPLRFGLMHSALEREFTARGVSFIPVTDLGAGSPDEQALRAVSFLEENGHLGEPSNQYVIQSDLHILGHSVGGLVARSLSQKAKLRHRVKTIITVGTPHRGARVAERGVEFPRRYPFLQTVLQKIGYDTALRQFIFQQFTREAVTRFNESCPQHESAREITLLCEAQGSQISLPLKVLALLPQATDQTQTLGDGFIESDSQIHGEVIDRFALDHFSQLGVFLHVSAAARRNARLEFQRLIDTVTKIVLESPQI
jgi:pimeloyl-ACP methyl ester carboxylesterase